MAEHTEISWSDATFNPWIGCTKVSPACDHCYAEEMMDKRYGRVKWGGERVRTSAANWKQPLAWNRKAEREGRRLRVFCASLADVFDNQVPEQWREDLFGLISATPTLDWLLLTKRPQNIAKLMPPWLAGDGIRPNVWLGTTVENQEEADRRIPHLLSVPARVCFLSCEPLLGPLDLTRWLDRTVNGRFHAEPIIDWVIAGGESGAKARPMHPDWARSLRDQCAPAGTAFHFKQWGEWAPGSSLPIEARVNLKEATVLPDGRVREWQPDYPESRLIAPGMTSMRRVGKKAAGRILDGRTHDEFPA